LDDPRSGQAKEIIIHDNVWLGAGAIVLKGVEIGENTVIGAASVVTKNIPANVIAAGNPCKVIRSI
jgi:acetyltransferase-like isoleucine patch superfamily enzyme